MATFIHPNPETAQAIHDLYAITNRLNNLYPGRHFTPDGHMVGSLGEVVAADYYGLKLFEASRPVHDAEDHQGRLIQIKATQGTRVSLNEEHNYLIVLLIHPDGSFEEICNGPGKQVWEACGKQQKTSQRPISLTKLRTLNQSIQAAEKIAPPKLQKDSP